MTALYWGGSVLKCGILNKCLKGQHPLLGKFHWIYVVVEGDAFQLNHRISSNTSRIPQIKIIAMLDTLAYFWVQKLFPLIFALCLLDLLLSSLAQLALALAHHVWLAIGGCSTRGQDHGPSTISWQAQHIEECILQGCYTLPHSANIISLANPYLTAHWIPLSD